MPQKENGDLYSLHVSGDDARGSFGRFPMII